MLAMSISFAVAVAIKQNIWTELFVTSSPKPTFTELCSSDSLRVAISGALLMRDERSQPSVLMPNWILHSYSFPLFGFKNLHFTANCFESSVIIASGDISRTLLTISEEVKQKIARNNYKVPTVTLLHLYQCLSFQIQISCCLFLYQEPPLWLWWIHYGCSENLPEFLTYIYRNYLHRNYLGQKLNDKFHQKHCRTLLCGRE